VAVVTEVMYLLDHHWGAQRDFLTWVKAGALHLVEAQYVDLERVVQLMDKYANVPMDFTAGVLVAICERLDVRAIATVDTDFTVYRFKGRGRFENRFLEP
jgi:predicted nucleic acid-binding protein